MQPPEPRTEEELLARSRALAGRTLGELAAALAVAPPGQPGRAKGWVGQLVERGLGGRAGSKAQADFAALGIELKTLPIDARGRPRESTFVTTLDLADPRERAYETSRLRGKLEKVLWVPVEADASQPLLSRRVGWPVLWSPSAEDEAVLREDFAALVELCADGLEHRATAHHGRYLQLRPKGANARALKWSVDGEGAPVRTAPRAFYLRASFTRRLLAERWIVPGA